MSLGGATFLEWQKGNQISIYSPYLNNVGLSIPKNELSSELIQKTAQILLSNGNAEVGPRALGKRSLLALPNNKELSRQLSKENIKLFDGNYEDENIKEDFDKHIADNWDKKDIEESNLEYEKNPLVFLNEYLYAKEKNLSFDFLKKQT